MTIRTIRKSDTTILAQFEQEISTISFGADAVFDLDFYKRKIEKAMLKEQQGMLVLEVDEAVAGWLWMAVKENYLSHEKYVSFKSFYIAEPYRGTPAVKALMDAGMKFCRKQGAKTIIGKVHVKNLPMQIVYKNYGFAPTHLTMEYDMK